MGIAKIQYECIKEWFDSIVIDGPDRNPVLELNVLLSANSTSSYEYGGFYWFHKKQIIMPSVKHSDEKYHSTLGMERASTQEYLFGLRRYILGEYNDILWNHYGKKDVLV